MINQPTYDHYCSYYAKKCKLCQGTKRVNQNNVACACSCQIAASAKWRFDQIRIYPEELKYKTWNDFRGYDGGVLLDGASFVKAREAALEYCFDSSNNAVIEDRKNNLKVLDRIREGRNVIITGDKGSGRSLVALLILKEIVYASALTRANIEFRWARATEIIDAARWSGHSESVKEIDYNRLYDWESAHFLFIDNVDLLPVRGDHRHPPDITSLNLMFGGRLFAGLPTIVVCSFDFWHHATAVESVKRDEIRVQWGDEFYTLLTEGNNTVIHLRRQKRELLKNV